MARIAHGHITTDRPRLRPRLASSRECQTARVPPIILFRASPPPPPSPYLPHPIWPMLGKVPECPSSAGSPSVSIQVLALRLPRVGVCVRCVFAHVACVYVSEHVVYAYLGHSGTLWHALEEPPGPLHGVMASLGPDTDRLNVFSPKPPSPRPTRKCAKRPDWHPFPPTAQHHPARHHSPPPPSPLRRKVAAMRHAAIACG